MDFQIFCIIAFLLIYRISYNIMIPEAAVRLVCFPRICFAFANLNISQFKPYLTSSSLLLHSESLEHRRHRDQSSETQDRSAHSTFAGEGAYQLNALHSPRPTKLAEIVTIPSCREPILYLVGLRMINFSCLRRFRMPV